jgi:hypothetical protein
MRTHILVIYSESGQASRPHSWDATKAAQGLQRKFVTLLGMQKAREPSPALHTQKAPLSRP